MYRILSATVASLLIGLSPLVAAEVETTMVPGGQDVPIAVTTWGNEKGPGVLLIHGFLASTLNWQKQIDGDLGQRFNMAAVDMRGHGSSAKPWGGSSYLTTRPWADDIAAAMKSAGLEKPVLVAWSYGGFFAMDYVRHYGTSGISGIVLVGNSAGLLPAIPQGEPTPERLDQIRRSRSPNLKTISEWTDSYLSFLISSGPLPPKEVELIKISAMLAPHYIRPFLRDRPTDNTDLAGRLDVPVLFISGSKDASLTPATVREAAARIPGSRVSIFDGLGNMMFWYDPARFDREITQFVEQVNATAATQGSGD